MLMMSSGSTWKCTFRIFFAAFYKIRFRFTDTVAVGGNKSSGNTCPLLGALGVNIKSSRATIYSVLSLDAAANSLNHDAAALTQWVCFFFFSSPSSSPLLGGDFTLSIYYYCCRRSRSLGFIYLLLCAAHEHNPSAHDHCRWWLDRLNNQMNTLHNKWSQYSLHCNCRVIDPNFSKNCGQFVIFCSFFLGISPELERCKWSALSTMANWLVGKTTEIRTTSTRKEQSQQQQQSQPQVPTKSGESVSLTWPGRWLVSKWVVGLSFTNTGQLEFDLRNGRTIMKVMGKSFPMGHSTITCYATTTVGRYFGNFGKL